MNSALHFDDWDAANRYAHSSARSSGRRWSVRRIDHERYGPCWRVEPA